MFVTGKISYRRVGSILLVSSVLLWILLNQVQQPIQERISDRYRLRGDSYFAALDYAEAQNQYRLALKYNPHNQLAQQELDMAAKAAVDLTAAKPFFEGHNLQEPLSKLHEAQRTFTDAKAAVVAGVGYYNKGEFVYAQYPLQQAVTLDPEYPEAWHYLGLTYQELAKSDFSYQHKAQECFDKRDALTPKYLSR